MICRPQ